MKPSFARVTIRGITQLSQSRQHDEPKIKGEGPDAYDQRTWRFKLNVEERDGKRTVVIPAHGMQQCIVAAAKYAKEKITGKGGQTWTQKFTSGIALIENIPLGIDPDTVTSITISANADGVRGSGKRVTRRFPVIPTWHAEFDVMILDPIITEDIFREMLEKAGMFIGLGRFRAEKGGTNGRFVVEAITWTDNREMAA